MSLALVIAFPCLLIEELVEQLYKNGYKIGIVNFCLNADADKSFKDFFEKEEILKYNISIVPLNNFNSIYHLIESVNPDLIFYLKAALDDINTCIHLNNHQTDDLIKKLQNINYKSINLNKLTTLSGEHKINLYSFPDVINEVAKVAQGQSKNMCINSNHESLVLITGQLLFNIMQSNFQSLIKEVDMYNINYRDFFRSLFEELGVEIEFSGKGNSEKAVILDADEYCIEKYNFDVALLKPGQTIIKSNSKNEALSILLFTKKNFNIQNFYSTINNGIKTLLKEYIEKQLSRN